MYIQSGKHTFEVVDKVPLGYVIWNIGKNMTDGWLPLCKVIPGTYKVETDTLKAVRCDGAQIILQVTGYGLNTLNKMYRYLNRYEKRATNSPVVARKVKLIYAALPYMLQIQWEGQPSTTK